MAGEHKLSFLPFSSALHPAFWSVLVKKKLEELKLDERPLSAKATYANNTKSGLPASLFVEWNTFDEEIPLSPSSFVATGEVLVKNTKEAMIQHDKVELLNQEKERLLAAFKSGEALEKPSVLSRFVLLMFADLKKYTFHYWFAFPALALPIGSDAKKPVRVSEVFPEDARERLAESYREWKRANPAQSGFFFIDKSDMTFVCLKDGMEKSCTDLIPGFADPSSYAEFPGWPLRNLAGLLHFHGKLGAGSQEVLCLRQDGTRIDNSVIVRISCKEPFDESKLKCVGWEKNDKGQLAPYFVNLKSSLDPAKLAESACDLNLKLMKWRLVPELNLVGISATKCLLLGSGTLGCNVARCLLGWGVRNITFVDNGKVSYSNPVRQSLFNFEDCLDSGKPKALAAAEAMKRIFPGCNANAFQLTVPMPGHPISDSLEQEVRKDFETLDRLVQDHDVIFLLMDSRESRWLPTLMGASYQKLVINAALGFDSYLVMRHGIRDARSFTKEPGGSAISSVFPGCRLGCYFCNDVVAPGNSSRDRTLDQQCTVTRPGVSYQAGALAVELMVSTLEHPERGNAPASVSAKNFPAAEASSSHGDPASLESTLGLVPHSVRGSLHAFSQMLPTTPLFANCTACSERVVGAFGSESSGGKFEFLSRACNEPSFLEDLVGLTELMAEAADVDDVIEMGDDDFSDFESE